MKIPFSLFEGFSFSRFVVRRRVTLMLITVIVLITLMVLRNYRPTHDVLNFRNPWAIGGLLCIALGLAIRSWSAAILKKGEVLATQGPYSVCRHPLYLGSLLLVVGFGVIIGDPWAAVILMSVLLTTYPATIRHEERMIAATFPDQWPAYSAATPRLLPRRLPSGFGPATWARWLHNREYRAIMAASIGLLAMAAWRHLLP